MKTAQQVEETLSKVIKTITDGKAQTVFQGQGFSVSPNSFGGGYTVKMAAIPENHTSTFIRTLDGFALHECGHVLFSDFFTVRNPVVKSILNFIEDYRIEYLMKARYAGAARSIDFSNQATLLDVFSDVTPDEINWKSVCLALAVLINGYQEWADSNMLGLVDLVSKSVGELVTHEAIMACGNTRGVHKLSLKVYDKLKELMQQQKDEQDKQEDSQKDEQENQDNSQEDQDGQQDNSDDSSGNDASNDSDSGDSEDKSDKGSGGTSDSGSEDGQNSSSDTGFDAGSTGDDSKENSDTQSADSNKDSAKSDKIKKINMDESLADLGNYRQKYMEKLVGGLHQSSSAPKNPRPYTRNYDKVIKEKSNNSHVQPNLKAKQAAIRLANFLKSQAYTSYERGLNRGKLDTHNIYRIGLDDKIFKRKHAAKIDFDVCFVVGVDVSGSMPRNHVIQLFDSVFSILSALGVPFSVFTYTSQDDNTKIPYDLLTAMGRASKSVYYTRYLPLIITTIKDFNDAANIRRGAFEVGKQGSTPTPEAFEHAAKLLANRKETRKIFINITDGVPTEIPAIVNKSIPLLKTMMSEFKRKGYQYLNIGYRIRPDFLKQVDPKAVVTDENKFYSDFVGAVKNIFK